MAQKTVSAGDEYAKEILMTIKDMMQTKFTCDFKIKVETEIFDVHSNVISAASPYFKAMISNDMRENREKAVDMKEADPLAVKSCIDFMYTGEALLNISNIVDILHTSNLIQLTQLTELCFVYLEENMSADTCLITIALAKLYGREKLQTLAEQVAVKQFETVIHTSEFTSIGKEDLCKYLKLAKVNHHVKWTATVTWLQCEGNSKDFIMRLLNVIEVRNFPYSFLLNTVLISQIIQENEPARNSIVKLLLCNLNVLKENITVGTFFKLRFIAKSLSQGELKKAKQIFESFMLKHFEGLCKEDEFVNIGKDEILSLLQSPDTEYSNEKVKWEAVLKWIKYDRRRKKHFLRLFKCIKIEVFHPQFIGNHVLAESLVKESHECKDLVLAAFFPSSTTNKNSNACIAFIDPKDGAMNTIDLVNNIRFTLPNLSNDTPICLLTIEDKIYVVGKREIQRLERNQHWVGLSLTKQNMQFVSVATTQKKIFMVSTNVMFCFEIEKNKWTTNLPGCGLGERFCTAALGKYIYAMGGYETWNKATKYDVELGMWIPIAPMLNTRWYASAAVVSSRIYVIGGAYDNRMLISVECFSPEEGLWTNRANMNDARTESSTCVIDNKLYVVGGAVEKSGKWLQQNSVETYNCGSNTWSKIKVDGLPVGRVLCCAYNRYT